ncbi:DUF2141 domain-containing protein [Luteimonas sp. 3794]|uniref:DUF2141 domain-containing protein n=1 Tax=Luteimonas sp. 3794 TaxID=2817730 RepID=UPI0028648751|nr:DUF2141 domain-containing protein [Luteimonas sp. 3794]MDR6990122.1 uncharacterized protein (DUF2141 family) [Luteimonas sp. 3794]
MRRIPASFITPFALLAVAAIAAPVQAGNLDVSIREARSASGQFQVALVDAAGYAGSAAPIAARLLAPAGDVTRVRFDGVAPGRYALMVIHDENGNGTLDTNLMGMPVEGYGFSNNPPVLRKPTFDEAAFEIGADPLALDVTIR